MVLAQELLAKIESGNSDACFTMGCILASISDKESNKRALYYFLKGSEIDDNPLCYFALGEAYLFGEIASIDLELSDACYVKAIDSLFERFLAREEPQVAMFIGGCYFRSPTLLDYEKAFFWFNKNFEVTKDPKAREMMDFCLDLSLDLEQMENETAEQAAATSEMVEDKTELSRLAKDNSILRKPVAKPPLLVSSPIYSQEMPLAGSTVAPSESLFKSVAGFVKSLFSSSGGVGSGGQGIGKGKMVLDGVHRYIEKSSGERIAIESYDMISGIAKGYDNKSYKLDGTISQRDTEHR